MALVIKNRSEILFLYDVTDSNPNGDPVDENKPRIDEETGINIVTDVRLKRTIRDYLYDYKGHDIFILEKKDEKGNLRTKEDRLSDFKDSPEEVKNNCIDVRLFGATIAVKEKTLTLTGPVQFKYGKSLHKVSPAYIKGTTVMPSKQDKKQGTFTEKYILPYSLICFYGIINENAALNQGIHLAEDDISFLSEGIWLGTKNLISGSKFGQVPRFLMQVVYKEKANFFIGELDKRVALIKEVRDEEIRDISQVKLDVSELFKAIESNTDKIEKILLKVDERVTMVKDGKENELKKVLGDITVEDFPF